MKAVWLAKAEKAVSQPAKHQDAAPQLGPVWEKNINLNQNCAFHHSSPAAHHMHQKQLQKKQQKNFMYPNVESEAPAS